MTKRVFLIVLDSVGIGEAKDAAAFGDGRAHTMKSISDSSYFAVPNLLSLGLGNIPGLSFLGTTPVPLAAYARVEEQSADALGDKSRSFKKSRDSSVCIVFIEAEKLHPDVN